MQGRLLRWDPNAKMGVIRGPDKQDYPLTANALPAGVSNLTPYVGQTLEFQGRAYPQPEVTSLRLPTAAPVQAAKPSAQREKPPQARRQPPVETEPPKRTSPLRETAVPETRVPVPDRSGPPKQSPSPQGSAASGKRSQERSPRETPPVFPSPSDQPPEPADGFVNPYNFVPPAGDVPRGEPKSHEYCVGHSGRITCTLTLKTPFFLPDPERRDKDTEDHETLYLLRDTLDRALIPGSALKGIFRSVAEALSNSCLSVFDEEAHYSRRPRPIPAVLNRRQIGVVKSLPEGDRPGKIAPAKKAKVFFQPGAHNETNSRVNEVNGWRDGTPVIAKIDHRSLRSRSGHRFEYNQASQVQEGHSGQGRRGLLKVTAIPEQSQKKSQRLVYDIASNPQQWKDLSLDVVKAYNQANTAGREDDEKNRRQFTDGFAPADPGRPERGLREKRHELRAGDTVYFDEEQGQIVRIGPVELFRELYPHGVKDGLPTAWATCKTPTDLCPCCRLFGWIPPDKEKRERAEEEARSGFVRFSAAHSTGPVTGETEMKTLKPLGQPHPSAMSFYLQAVEDPQQKGSYEHDSFELRGRKFYWHQQVSPADVEDTRDGGEPLRDNQNKTVELLREGVTYTFIVEFDNLSEADLGLLLLTLQPNLLGSGNVPSMQLYHKIGMGKPLGLGSAAVQIQRLTLINRAVRYQSLGGDGATTYVKDLEHDTKDEVPPAAQPFVDAFVQAAFTTDAQKARLRNLLVMLDWEHKPSGVQYPPGPPEEPEKSFAWFQQVDQRLLTPREIWLCKKRQQPYADGQG
jgi:CRISPR-associated protein (TIGR03986 family)